MWPRKENIFLWCFAVAFVTGVVAYLVDWDRFLPWGPLLEDKILWPTVVLGSAFGATTLMTGSWIPLFRAQQRARRLVTRLDEYDRLLDAEKPIRVARLIQRPQLSKLYKDAAAVDLPKKIGALDGLDWHLDDLWIIASNTYRPWAKILRDTLRSRNSKLKVGYQRLRQGEPADVFCRMHCYAGSRKCFAFVSADLVGDPIGKMQINNALLRHNRPGSTGQTFLHATAVDEGGYRYMVDRKELEVFAKLVPVANGPGPHLGLIRNVVEVLETDLGLGAKKDTDNSVFISYSHKNAEWLEEMTSALRDAGLDATLWDDRRIPAASKFEHEISVQLLTSRAVVLLVSEQFLASNFIQSRELKGALQLAEDGHLKLFWLTVSECNLRGAELEKFQAVHDSAEPLDSMSADERKAVWQKLNAAIRGEMRRGSSG